jgi:HEAT repeat protein
LRRNVAKALGDIGKATGLPVLRAMAGDAHTAGVAIEALVKVLRWDAVNAERSDLGALAKIDDPDQVPWMIDEGEEAASGRSAVREGKAWSVDATNLRALALAEIRRRDKDG